MADEYLMAILKNSIGESSLPSIKEGDSPSSPPSFCPSSKNSSVGDFEDQEYRKDVVARFTFLPKFTFDAIVLSRYHGCAFSRRPYAGQDCQRIRGTTD